MFTCPHCRKEFKVSEAIREPRKEEKSMEEQQREVE